MSDLERTLLFQIKAVKLPEPEQQWHPIPGRQFRFDFAWPGHKIGVEVDGQGRKGGKRCPVCKQEPRGGHETREGYESGCEKQNLAALQGFRTFRFTAAMIEDGRALATLEQALEAAQ